MSEYIWWLLGYETDAERIKKHNTISYLYGECIETCPKLMRGKYEYTQDIKNNNFILSCKKNANVKKKTSKNKKIKFKDICKLP
jgi:hypothetical protein